MTTINNNHIRRSFNDAKRITWNSV